MRDLEAELDLEQRRARDAAAENKKLAKQLADLRAQADDDHRTVAELNDHVTTLETRIITLKRQLEENVRRPITSLPRDAMLARYVLSSSRVRPSVCHKPAYVG